MRNGDLEVAELMVRHFDDRLAGPLPDLRRQHARVEDEVLALDERLGQEHRIGDDADVREVVAVTDEMLGQRRAIAFGQAVAANPALLDVGGGDGQHVAFPRAGREPLPGVRRVLGRMRTAVHPDRARLFVGADVVLDRDERLGLGIALFPDAQLQRTAIDVRRNVHLALVLVERQARRVPAERPLARRFGDREAEIVDEVRTGDALGLIFVIARSPAAGEIGLRARWRRREGDRDEENRRDVTSAHRGAEPIPFIHTDQAEISSPPRCDRSSTTSRRSA